MGETLLEGFLRLPRSVGDLAEAGQLAGATLRTYAEEWRRAASRKDRKIESAFPRSSRACLSVPYRLAKTQRAMKESPPRR
jgi:hypothetical protein